MCVWVVAWLPQRLKSTFFWKIFFTPCPLRAPSTRKNKIKNFDFWGIPKLHFLYFYPLWRAKNCILHTTCKYNRQNFIDEQTKVARCRWEIMQPNGNNSHSSKCREEQKKKDNFSRPQFSLWETFGIWKTMWLFTWPQRG